MRDIIFWEDPASISAQYTYEYWNNEQEERKKAWFVDDESDTKLKAYLDSSGLLEEFELAINKVGEGNIGGNILDCAAGVCWTSALLSKIASVVNIDSLEFSKHRLEIAPKVIANLNGNEAKINRIYGSFYNIKNEASSYDLILLSQAFHHADKPLKLLSECDKVLKPSGKILIIGEHVVSPFKFLKAYVKYIIKYQAIPSCSLDIFPPDEELGDHYYTVSDYYLMFKMFGYKLLHHKSNIRNSMILVAEKM